jgi:hypothetical protein
MSFVGVSNFRARFGDGGTVPTRSESGAGKGAGAGEGACAGEFGRATTGHGGGGRGL